MALKSCTQQHLELLTSGYIRQFIGFKKAASIIYETVNNYAERKHLTLGLFGTFRSGKSTLAGRMFYEYNHRNHSLSDDGVMEHVSSPKDERWSAYFDEDEDEQLRQMTIHGMIHEIYTMSYQISLIDTPGYKQYIKNFIRYISQSDVVILCFGANDLMEKAVLSNKPTTPNADKLSFDGYFQLLDKLRICQLFEIKQIIVAINKLDKFNYSKSRYTQCKNEIEQLLKKVGYTDQYKNKIPIIPISAINGDNILSKSRNGKLKWWTNTEKGGFKIQRKYSSKIVYTVYDAIECINFSEIKMYNKDNIFQQNFKMSISNVYDECNINGSVLSGRIENGKISIGTTIKCFPSGCYGQIKSIQMFNKSCKSAIYGDVVGLSLDSFLLHPQRGDIIINENNTKEYEVTTFEALIDVYPSNDKINKKYKKAKYNKEKRNHSEGFSPLIMTNNSLKCQCTMIDILWKLNKNVTMRLSVKNNDDYKSNNENGKKSNGKINQKIENPPFLEAGDTAKVLFSPSRQFPISALQKVVVLEHQQVVMAGKITKLHYADEVTEDF